MENLRTLGVYSNNYEKVLVLVLNAKLPFVIRTLFARKFSENV